MLRRISNDGTSTGSNSNLTTMMFSRVGNEKLTVPVIRHETYHKDVHRRFRSCPLDWFTLKMKALQSFQMLGTVYQQQSVTKQ